MKRVVTATGIAPVAQKRAATVRIANITMARRATASASSDTLACVPSSRISSWSSLYFRL